MLNQPHAIAPPVQPRHIGARIPRSDDGGLLTGRGQYVADIRLTGELHMAVLRSTMGHATIEPVDTTAAREAEGVHAAWTAQDIHDLCPGIEVTLAVEGCVPVFMPLLADGAVRHVGEPIAAVVAESRALAEDACERIVVEYEPLPVVTDLQAALAGGPLANETLESNVTVHGAARFGDVDKAFAAAAKIVEATYHTGRLSAAPMEGRGALAQYSWLNEELKLWTSTQIPHLIAFYVSLYCGFPEHLVEVLTPDTGGGFGQKAHVYPEELLVCMLARELDRPVKWIEDRAENLMAATHAHEQSITIAYALDEDARIIGQRMHAVGDGGAYHSVPWSMAIESYFAVWLNAAGVYDIPTWGQSHHAVATNKTPIGAYRGVGYMANNVVHEALADEAARALGLSPFDFRRRNVVKRFPYTNAQGILYDEGSWAESIDVLERLVDHEAFRERQARLREEGRYLGLGISVFVESTGESTVASQEHGLNDTYHDSATVRMGPLGKVTVTTGLPTQGQGNRLTMAQVAADALGVRVEDVTVRCGESTKHAWGSGTVASRGAIVMGGAILRSSDVIRTKLKRVAAVMLEASEDDIVLLDGVAQVAGDPQSSLPIADVATAIYYDNSKHPEDFDPSLEVTLAYDPPTCLFSNGAQAYIVEVDVETGFVEIEHVFAVEDCGRMINPAIVEGQIRGGMTQGIGAALFEELVYDEDGQLLTTTFADYMLPTLDVVPRFTFEHLETPSSRSPGGIKGMGESGLIASPGAMLNAVNDALSPFGATLRRIPLTPERILEALDAARQDGARGSSETSEERGNGGKGGVVGDG
jgi:CO/xanthine dehydrogenase Mo-binding subunit